MKPPMKKTLPQISAAKARILIALLALPAGAVITVPRLRR